MPGGGSDQGQGVSKSYPGCVRVRVRAPACVPQCGPVCFCVWRYCVCESRPLTAAELSLIQLCLLSCLLVAAAPGSALALPQLSPPGLRPASRPGLWPASGSQSLLLGAFSVSASEGSCLFLHVSTCPLFVHIFFFLSQFLIQSTNLFSHLPPTLPHLSHCAGAGGLSADQTRALLLRPGGKTGTALQENSAEGPQGRQHSWGAVWAGPWEPSRSQAAS